MTVVRFYLFLRFRVGFPLRFVSAILRSSALLIDLYIPLEAPLSEDTLRFPRLAASAAPAAICCFFDFAGIHKQFVYQRRNGFFASPRLLETRASPMRSVQFLAMKGWHRLAIAFVAVLPDAAGW